MLRYLKSRKAVSCILWSFQKHSALLSRERPSTILRGATAFVIVFEAEPFRLYTDIAIPQECPLVPSLLNINLPPPRALRHDHLQELRRRSGWLTRRA